MCIVCISVPLEFFLKFCWKHRVKTIAILFNHAKRAALTWTEPLEKGESSRFRCFTLRPDILFAVNFLTTPRKVDLPKDH